MTSPKISRDRTTEVLCHEKGFTPFEIARSEDTSGAPARSRFQTGFTLIEVLVVIGIFLLLAGLSLGIGVDTVRRATVGSERTVLVQLLERARSRAMNNIGNAPHGVVVTSTSFVLFEGATYVPASPLNESSPRSDEISVTGPTDPVTVVFDQLSGAVDAGEAGDIVLSNGAQTYTISLNTEGRIDW